MIKHNKLRYLLVGMLFFVNYSSSFEAVRSFFDRQRIALEKKAISFAFSHYLFFSPSMTTTLMGIQGLHGYLVGLTSDKQTSIESHARKLFNAVAFCKIGEHIIFNDTGFKGFGSGHYYHHVMTLLSITFGYSLGYSTRIVCDNCIQSPEESSCAMSVLGKNSL